MVVLKAPGLPVLREVKTESWLGVDYHRRGLGTEARTALLHLAFEELGAVAAVSEVFQDNAASQGVSRKLGTVMTASPVTFWTAERLCPTGSAWMLKPGGRHRAPA